MKTRSIAEPQFEEARQPRVLLIYEDAITGVRAKLALDRVFSRPEVMSAGHFHAWRLDLLRYPTCQAEATQEALDADIIVLSTHGNNRMAQAAEASLRQWVGLKRDRPCALVISLDADTQPLSDSNPTLLELRAKAAHNGLTVLLQFGDATLPEMNDLIADVRIRADLVVPALENYRHGPTPLGSAAAATEIEYDDTPVQEICRFNERT